MRDLVLFVHIIIGIAIIVLPILILVNINKKSSFVRLLAFLSALLSWLLLLPAGKLYTTFYPATKTLILASSKPWLHSILMETKEHWGILLPIIATVAAGLVFKNKTKESKKWWILLIILSILLAIMGRVIKLGALS